MKERFIQINKTPAKAPINFPENLFQLICRVPPNDGRMITMTLMGIQTAFESVRCFAAAMATVIATAALTAWRNTGEETLNSPLSVESVLRNITASSTQIFLRPDAAFPEIRSL